MNGSKIRLEISLETYLLCKTLIGRTICGSCVGQKRSVAVFCAKSICSGLTHTEIPYTYRKCWFYLPVENFSLFRERIFRYGKDKQTVTLNKLGGVAWQTKKKTKAKMKNNQVIYVYIKLDKFSRGSTYLAPLYCFVIMYQTLIPYGDSHRSSAVVS